MGGFKPPVVHTFDLGKSKALAPSIIATSPCAGLSRLSKFRSICRGTLDATAFLPSKPNYQHYALTLSVFKQFWMLADVAYYLPVCLYF